MHSVTANKNVFPFHCDKLISHHDHFISLIKQDIHFDNMSPIIPSRYGHPKYNIFPQKSRATSLGGIKGIGSQRGTPGSDSKSRRKQKIEESKITVQPKEDEEADNFFSKQLAAARFQRNHKLINVLFSEVVVDQDQNNSDHEKAQANRVKRMKSLEEYKEKIDKDIMEMNEKFNARKSRIVEDGKRFNERLEAFIGNSRKELEVLRVAQRNRQEIRKVLNGIIESVAQAV